MKGGGIDFLGLRAVNLRMLAQFLLPGLNNATRDFGNFCVAAWIPWKFHRTHQTKELFTEARYAAFQERMEIAMAHGIRWDGPGTAEFGNPHGRIGDRQQIEFPNSMRFSTVSGRTKATSLFAAALYGPSMHYLGLLPGFYRSVDGERLTRIPAAGDDLATRQMVEFVDISIHSSPVAGRFLSPGFESATKEELEDVCVHGLNPPFYRTAPIAVKEAFLGKLFAPSEDGTPNPRLLTARLIRETLTQARGISSVEMRRIWHTGLVSSATPFHAGDSDVVRQRERWAIFQGRQIQRYVIETFLRVFELALADGRRSIDSICDWTLKQAKATGGLIPKTFRDLVRAEGRAAGCPEDLDQATLHWNGTVCGDDIAYEWMDLESPETEPARALRMLARWFIRARSWPEIFRAHTQIHWDGANRISLTWFVPWIEQRMDWPLGAFLEEFFSELVFNQHLRTALSRFDGKIQRLRFLLGDEGIVPTGSSQGNLGKGEAPWMADRLDAFVNLLSDLDVLEVGSSGGVLIGRNADFLLA